MIDAALKIAGKRKPVFPCKLDKAPHYEKNVLEHGCLDATTNPSRITAWWNRWPEANIGIPTGEASGLLVVDFDTYKPGAMTVEEFEEKYGIISHTATVRTGSGGLQAYFVYPEGEEIRNNAGSLGPHVDVRGEGGYVLAPPSVTTGRYEWINKASPAPLPQKLLDALREQPRSSSKQRRPEERASFTDDGEPIPDGRRNETLASIAGRLHDGTRDLGQLENALLDVNEGRCIPPLPSDQVRRIARSIHRYEPCRPARPEPDPETVAALAEIERAILQREYRGLAGKTEYSISVAYLKLARKYGTLAEDGVRVEASVRQRALAAGVSRRTIVNKDKTMTDVLRPDNEDAEPGKSGAIVLLLPRAALHHSTHGVSSRGGCAKSRAPFTAPRLRWSSPARKPRRGVTPGTCKVRDGVVSKKRDAVIRLGKSCERVVDSLEAAGGSMTLPELADALYVKRPRDLTRRKNSETGKGRDGFVTRLRNVGVLDVCEDNVSLTGDWLEALNRERSQSGEIELYQRDMRRFNRESKAYSNRDKVKVDYHYVNVGADGHVEELRRDDEPRDSVSDPAPVSPLAAAIRDYLDRNPHDADQLPGWIGSTLWAFDLFKGKPTPAGVRTAIGELGGEAYLRGKLSRAREAA